MSSNPRLVLRQRAFLAELYIVTGALGLVFAVPPGYATIIWPPSGFAVGMLVLYGWRLWPGILVGSFLLNSYISSAWTFEHGLNLVSLGTALLIALGSSAQALISRALIARFIGLPLQLDRSRQLLLMILLAGPVGCTVAASVGVATLYLAGAVHIADFAHNWLAWWGGDTFGVLIFLPMQMAASASRATRVVWQTRNNTPALAVVSFVTPLALAFYAWQVTNRSWPVPLTFGSALLLGLLMASMVRAALLAKLQAVQLAEANKVNSAMLSGAASLIIATDAQGVITVFNRAAEEALGYRAKDLIGRETPALWHDRAEIEQREREISAELRQPTRGFEAVVAKARRQQMDHMEWTFISKRGERIPVALAITPMKDSDGLITGFMGVAEMIAGRKAAEAEQRRARESLHVSEERYRLLVRGIANYAICGLTPEGRISSWNIGAHHLNRYSEEELLGKDFSIFYTEEARLAGRPEQALREAATTGAFAAEEWRERKDGTRFWASVVIEPIRSPDGAILGFVQIAHDETARRETERQRKQAEDALRTSEETFRSAMESASIGMALVFPHGRFMKVNTSLCTLLGYSEAELLATDFQAITHAEDLEADLHFVKRVLSGEINQYRMEKRYLHKSGRQVWATLSVSIVRDTQGVPSYFIAQIHDITEQKEIERLKNEFISVVSHELRTPLTSIRGSLGLILGPLSQNLSDRVKGMVDIAHKNCERLILLINDILDIDKIAAGRMRFDMQTCSIADMADKAVQAMEAYAQRLSVQVVIAPIDERLCIRVDEDRLIQVLNNLLSNAAKFSPKHATVMVTARVRGESVLLSVADRGPGIPEEFRPRIFDKFSQADGSGARRAGGTGLGLHIARQMVEHMGGHIGFHSEIGRGTTFWVEFPLLAALESSDSGIVRAAVAAGDRPEVLHVEPDLDLSRVVAAALASHAQVTQARDLKRAERLLRQRAFSLVLLELNLPDGSGVELLTRLAILAEIPPPVILLCDDVPTPEVADRVAAVLVKTRVTEDRIAEAILSVLRQNELPTPRSAIQ